MRDDTVRPDLATGRDWLRMSGRTAFVAWLVAVLISLIPVLDHDFISTVDIYNHLARAAVLAQYDHVAGLQRFWLPNWRFLPNLALDLLAVGLLPWFSLAVVAQILIAASFGLVLGGAMTLSRVALGRWSAVSLLCALLLFNRMLLSGLLNYLFGIGLALFAIAAWIALREKPALFRGAVLSVCALAICTVHLFGFAVLALTVAGIELAVLVQRHAGLRQIVISLAVPGLALLPAMALLLLVAPHPEANETIFYRPLINRLSAFAVPLTYAPMAEMAGFVLIGLCLLGARITGRLRLDPRLAMAAGVMALVQLCMPDAIGAATAADHRIPIAFWIVGLCAIDLRLKRAWLAAGFMALVLGFGLFRVELIQARWTADGLIYAAAQTALKALPPGAKVATAIPSDALESMSGPAMTLYSMPAWVIVPQGGFTQTLYTKPTQHPLVMQPALRALADASNPMTLWQLLVVPQTGSDNAAALAKAMAVLPEYDYVAFLSPAPFTVAPTALLGPFQQALGIQIFRVRHPAASGG